MPRNLSDLMPAPATRRPCRSCHFSGACGIERATISEHNPTRTATCTAWWPRAGEANDAPSFDAALGQEPAPTNERPALREPDRYACGGIEIPALDFLYYRDRVNRAVDRVAGPIRSPSLDERYRDDLDWVVREFAAFGVEPPDARDLVRTWIRGASTRYVARQLPPPFPGQLEPRGPRDWPAAGNMTDPDNRPGTIRDEDVPDDLAAREMTRTEEARYHADPVGYLHATRDAEPFDARRRPWTADRVSAALSTPAPRPGLGELPTATAQALAAMAEHAAAMLSVPSNLAVAFEATGQAAQATGAAMRRVISVDVMRAAAPHVDRLVLAAVDEWQPTAPRATVCRNVWRAIRDAFPGDAGLVQLDRCEDQIATWIGDPTRRTRTPLLALLRGAPWRNPADRPINPIRYPAIRRLATTIRQNARFDFTSPGVSDGDACSEPES